ncbi:MAG: DUF3857 domain-containing protein [Chitinophagia bacterium]|nr:DUF3857 domain-containing protein [Chitinophagia bacterium]
MKKLAFSLVLAISATFGAQAQNNLPAIPEWEARPAVHPLPPQYNNEHAVIVLEDYTINYIYEAWDLQMYRTIHRIVKVMDRIGIESFNTVEIPLNTLIDSVKARTILPDGTIRDINSDMMHITRGANGGLKLIFAMEAVEKNAEIELLIHDMSNTRVFGAIQLQHAISVLHSVFRMNYPRDAAFEVKGYNGCPTPKEEATNNRKHITIYQQNLAALEPVPYADCDRYSMRVEYRLQHWINRVNQPSKEYDWNNFAENLYNNYYNLTAADRKAAMRFLTIAGIKGDESELTKIRKIEEAVKTKIVRSDFMDDDMGTNLDTVLDRRSATADGMLKLMSACFSLAGVTHELGYTSDRTENLIEASFPNYAIASQPVYYFPSFKTFLSPLAAYLRYPEVPWYLTGNLGVFCATNPSTGYSFGKNERVAEAKLRNIPAGKAESNVTTVTTNINLTTATEPKAEITTSYMVRINDCKLDPFFDAAISVWKQLVESQFRQRIDWQLEGKVYYKDDDGDTKVVDFSPNVLSTARFYEVSGTGKLARAMGKTQASRKLYTDKYLRDLYSRFIYGGLAPALAARGLISKSSVRRIASMPRNAGKPRSKWKATTMKGKSVDWWAQTAKNTDEICIEAIEFQFKARI